jgi:PDZ domain-containing protein
MHQRLIAAFIATPLVLILGVVALAVPLPFASYSPGPTFNILGTDSNAAHVVQVAGHKAYYSDGGQLRFTTVEASGDGDKLSLGEALGRWFNHSDAVLPYAYVHPSTDTASNEKQQGSVEMVTSQDLAKAAALHELGYKLTTAVKIAGVMAGTPADGKLEVGDEITAVNKTKIKGLEQVSAAIKKIGTHPLTLTVLRNNKPTKIRITPVLDQGAPRVGVSLAVGYTYPFDIELHVDPSIGGPSAGLMFSLAIYDTLTPGSLTGGAIVAGTGELGTGGQVEPIGGIAQKIAAANKAGAQLFFVPQGNCVDVKKLHPDGTRLVKATSVHEALGVLKKWAADHGADLPSC